MGRHSSLEQLVQKGELWVAAPPEHRLKSVDAARSSFDRGSFDQKVEALGGAKDELFERLLSLHRGSFTASATGMKSGGGAHVPFGVPEIDDALAAGGLACGAIHEWFLVSDGTLLPREGNAPHLLLSMLAASALRKSIEPGAAPSKFIFWIGRRQWPTPFLLARLLHDDAGHSLLSHCIFLDPPDRRSELWATEAVLRSKATAAVVAGGHKLSLTMSRRLSLAARQGGSLGLFIRDASDLTRSSAATSRWAIEAAPSPVSWMPRFKVSLTQHKGHQPPRTAWEVELLEESLDGTGSEAVSLRVLPEMVDRSRGADEQQAGEAPRRSGTR